MFLLGLVVLLVWVRWVLVCLVVVVVFSFGFGLVVGVVCYLLVVFVCFKLAVFCFGDCLMVCWLV